MKDDPIIIGAGQDVPARLVDSSQGAAMPPNHELRRVFRLRWSEIWILLSVTWNNFLVHKVPRLGAALAFYTMLSLAPLLVVIIAVAGWAFGREAAIGQMVWQI